MTTVVLSFVSAQLVKELHEWQIVTLFAYVLFLLLLSGIEASVCALPFTAWMCWSAAILGIARVVCRRGFAGPSFAVFAPFFTFAVFAHVSNTMLYVVAFLQGIAHDVGGLAFDCAVCPCANIVWRTVVRLSAFPRNRQNIPGAVG
jgi:hypothetical protein